MRLERKCPPAALCRGAFFCLWLWLWLCLWLCLWGLCGLYEFCRKDKRRTAGRRTAGPPHGGAAGAVQRCFVRLVSLRPPPPLLSPLPLPLSLAALLPFALPPFALLARRPRPFSLALAPSPVLCSARSPRPPFTPSRSPPFALLARRPRPLSLALSPLEEGSILGQGVPVGVDHLAQAV